MGYVNEILLIIVLVVSLVACKPADGLSANDDLNHKIDDSQSEAKVYLSEANSSQLEKKLEECPANPNNHRQCFVICHVPPGNPNNEHSLIVPLPAVNAHMNHGKNGHTPHKSGKDKGKDKASYRGDYMGRCDGSGNGGGTSGGTTGGTDGSTTGGTTGDDPVFCEWDHPMDLDCDGRNDETGELIF